MLRIKSKKTTKWVMGSFARENQSTNDNSGFDPDTSISEFESPTKSQANSELTTFTELTSDAVSRKRPHDKKTLVQQIKQTMLTYESSVKSFPYTQEFKNANTNDSSLILHLVILKCQYENVAIWTLSKDFDSKQYKWVIFKPKKSMNIRPGACVKLFHPWQQIFVPSLNDYVILCSDFCLQCDPVDIGTSLNVVKELITSVDIDVKWKQFSPASTSLFSTLVPYNVGNKNTVSKQIAFNKSSINLDLVVCQVWKTAESSFALVKDSDQVISALEILSDIEDLCNCLEPGRFISFSNLNVMEKVTTWSYMPIFSLISLYGSRQNFCYKLGMDSCTTWKDQLLLDIPFRIKSPKQKTLLEVSKMGDEDCRFNMRAKIKYLNPNQLIIWDDSTNLKGRVEIVSAYENQFSSNTTTEYVHLEYIRYFRGKLSLDRFSFMKMSQ